MDTYTLLVFVLTGLGFVVMAAEVLVPSLGLLSLLALLCFTGSTICAWKAWYATGEFVWWWLYIFGLILAIPSVLIGMFSLLPRTAFGRRIMAMPPNPEDVRPYVEEEARLRSLIDTRGLATSLFSPGGMVKIGSEKFHAESEGVLIDAGVQVIVVGLKGNRLVVRPLSMHRAASLPSVEINDEPRTPPDDARLPDGERLSDDERRGTPGSIDFDIPDAT